MPDTLRGAPEDWREVLAPFCPALRANLGLTPKTGRPMPALTIGEEGVSVTLLVPDMANRVTHAFDFDEFPTKGEMAAAIGTVYAPHN